MFHVYPALFGVWGIRGETYFIFQNQKIIIMNTIYEKMDVILYDKLALNLAEKTFSEHGVIEYFTNRIELIAAQFNVNLDEYIERVPEFYYEHNFNEICRRDILMKNISEFYDSPKMFLSRYK
jgi:hypothetical protein